ncbi:MAG: GAF domain-containing protein [Calditrichaeota bacterium]|nr:GAF domain-containing protein [Calditrichota bacterium]
MTIFRIVLVLILFFAVLPAQDEHFQFDFYSTDDGLSHSNIYVTYKDKYGFIWFGTNDGLSRYDGYEFINYRNDPEDSLSISGNGIRAIYQDSFGDLWIGTSRDGVSRYDYATEQFINYERGEQANDLQNNIVLGITEDKNQQLWLATFNGVAILNRERNSFIALRDTDKVAIRNSANQIMSIFKASDGSIYAGTFGNGLYIYNQDDYSRYHLTEGLPKNKSILSISEDKNHNIWFGCVDGVFIRPADGGLIYKAMYNNKVLDDAAVFTIAIDADNKAWIGTSDGLFLYDVERQKTSLIDMDISRSGLDVRTTRSVIHDEDGITWIGTLGGVYVHDPNKSRFKNYNVDPANPKSLNGDHVTAFAESDNGDLIIATNESINILNSDLQRKSSVPFTSKGLGSITAIVRDNQNNFWVSTYGHGLYKYDADFNQLAYFEFNVDTSNSYRNKELLSLYFQADKNLLWIGIFGGSIVSLNTVTEEIRYHSLPDLNEHLNGLVTVNTISKYDYRHLLLGTYRNSVLLFNTETSEATSLFDAEDRNRRILVNSILYDSLNHIAYIGTSNDGLIKYEFLKKKYINYTVKNGLPSNSVISIQKEADKYLWLGTNKGLSRYDLNYSVDAAEKNSWRYSGRLFKNFTRLDGLETNEFMNRSSLKSTDKNLLFFGHARGFSIVDFNTIKTNTKIPSPMLTKVRLLKRNRADNNPSIFSSVFKEQRLTLDYQLNDYTFEFSAMNYTNSHKNRYAFMLENYDEDWIYTDSRHFATYTNLDPGKYVFKVIASNNDGYWSDEPYTLEIRIRPPFWLTAWFNFLSILIMLAIILLFIRYRIKFIEGRNRLLKESNINLNKELEEGLKAKQALSELLGFEELISNLSADFINIPAKDIDQEIMTALGKLGQTLDLDRVLVYNFSEKLDQLEIKHVWQSEGISLIDQEKLLKKKEMPWLFNEYLSGKPVVIRQEKDFPSTASAEKTLFKDADVKSFISVPIYTIDTYLGVLILQSVLEPIKWADEMVKRCQLLAEILGNALSRKISEEKLEQRLSFETLISNISTEFINLPADDINKEFHSMLQLIGGFMDLDRCQIFEFNEEKTYMTITHEWTNRGIESEILLNRKVDRHSNPWLLQKLYNNEVIKINSIEDFPDKAIDLRNYYTKSRIKSMVYIPLVVGGDLLGFAAFDAFHAKRMWAKDDVSQLILIGEIFANAISRKKSETELENKLHFEALISSISTEFININASEIDREINRVLKTITTFIGVDRSVIYTFSKNYKEVNCKFEFCAAGVSPHINKFRAVQISEFPWLYSQLIQGNSVVVSQLDDIPSEGNKLREYLELTKTRSVIDVPFAVGGQIKGYIGYHSISKDRVWSDEFIQQTKLIGVIIANALQRKLIEQDLEERLKFEELISKLSTEFLRVSNSSTDEFRLALSKICHFMKVDRCQLFQANEDSSGLHLIYEYNMDGVQASNVGASAITANDFPWFFENYRKGISFAISRHSDYPKEATKERDHCIANGILSIAYSPIKAGATNLGVLVLDSVKEIKEWDEKSIGQIKVLGETLGNEIRHKQAENNRETLISELETKNAEMERFTYTVSHDLKSPLITIKGFLGVIERDLSDEKSRHLSEYINHMKGGVEKMHHLLDDLLELSRIGRLINKTEEFEVNRVVKDALSLVQGQIEIGKVTVEVKPDLPVIKGDYKRLIEVFQNLIDNAVKFMGNQENPRIEIGSINQNGDSILYVRDNGIGIEKKYQDKVFGLFERLSNDDKGTGVGLALVKRIIELHHGQIWVESEGEGTGTTFKFILNHKHDGENV